MYPHVMGFYNNDRNIWVIPNPDPNPSEKKQKKNKQDAAEECRKALESYLQGWQLVPWRCMNFYVEKQLCSMSTEWVKFLTPGKPQWNFKGHWNSSVLVPWRLFFCFKKSKNAGYLAGGFKHVYFYPFLGKWFNLTNMFQIGWFNHQPVIDW